MEHPYKSASPEAFWARSVAQAFDPASVAGSDVLVRRGEMIVSAGSCFAANVIPYIERAGLTYVRTAPTPHKLTPVEDTAYSYRKFSAPYGNIYTVRGIVQLLQRVLGLFRPHEDRWYIKPNIIVDPFRPGLTYPACSDLEFNLLTDQYLRDVRQAISKADVFIFTLGLTEAWVSAVDGAVFPACPGTVAGEFDPKRHIFHNFTVAEVTADLEIFINLLTVINPELRVILTVSPVPLIATATGTHVLSATVYSKSVLRVAASEAASRFDNVKYFPAYEIAAGPQAPQDFFEADRREPSQKAIDTIMSALLAHCDGISGDAARSPVTQDSPKLDLAAALSAAVVQAECEEAAAAL